MTNEAWTAVDNHIEDLLVGEDALLKDAVDLANREGLRAIQVAPNQGKMLQLLALVQQSGRILEIGTLGGYSTIWLARALPEHGKLITIELDPHHAEVAQVNLDRADLSDRVELRIGNAIDVLGEMIRTGTEPFDFIFIDADKPGYPAYLDLVLPLSRPGTLIIADNIVRNGGLANPASDDVDVIGVRDFVDQVAANPRLSATAIQTVGSKGWDGFALIRVES